MQLGVTGNHYHSFRTLPIDPQRILRFTKKRQRLRSSRRRDEFLILDPTNGIHLKRPYNRGPPNEELRFRGPQLCHFRYTAFQPLSLPYDARILSAHPSYHHRALGSVLICTDPEAVDKAGAQKHVETSPTGLSLYLRHEWEQVDEIAIDMRPHSGHGIEHQPFLTREQGAGSKLRNRREWEEMCVKKLSGRASQSCNSYRISWIFLFPQCPQPS